MGIQMQPEEFPERRRDDSKRRAEARVFDALRELELSGRAIYEFRYRKSGTQVDIALWLDRLARFAGQVKGGPHELDDAGQWLLRKPGGRLERVPSPLEEAVDGAIEMRNAIFEATGVKNFVAGLVIFPDMPRNEHWERVALNSQHVYILCGLDNLQADLERIAGEAQFFYPPKPGHSENEWRGAQPASVRGRRRRGRRQAISPEFPPGSTGKREPRRRVLRGIDHHQHPASRPAGGAALPPWPGRRRGAGGGRRVARTRGGAAPARTQRPRCRIPRFGIPGR